MNQKTILFVLVTVGLIVLPTACAGPAVSVDSTTPIAPITVGDDLTSIDLCQAIPRENIEAIMRLELVKPPTRYVLRNEMGTNGCFYEGPTDKDPTLRHFAYVILTPLDVYDNQPLFQHEDVSGIGDAAYFTRGADARQLWVKIDNKVAFVVGFGDTPNDAGAKVIAELMVAALK